MTDAALLNIKGRHYGSEKYRHRLVCLVKPRLVFIDSLYWQESIRLFSGGLVGTNDFNVSKAELISRHLQLRQNLALLRCSHPASLL